MPALTLSLLRKILVAILPLKSVTLENALELIAWIQIKNLRATKFHRKRKIWLACTLEWKNIFQQTLILLYHSDNFKRKDYTVGLAPHIYHSHEFFANVTGNKKLGSQVAEGAKPKCRLYSRLNWDGLL